MVRIETSGSLWVFDEELLRYQRMPKEERPREREEWSDERAGSLQDFVWHDYVRWFITDTSGVAESEEHGLLVIPPGTLMIVKPDGRMAKAPGARVL
jgi:hypothetical protein